MTDYDLCKSLIEASSDSQSLSIILIILVSLNIIIEVCRFFFAKIISNKEKVNKRQLFLEERRTRIVEQLFQSLDSLTLLTKDEESLMLNQIKEINLYVTKNKIHISKKIQKHTSDILDYFKNVLTDYRLKSIEKEIELFDHFCDEFNR